MFVVLDGFGWAPVGTGNATQLANMPLWHNFCNNYPGQLLQASGSAVGLLPGIPGNSEAGHMTLGAGRVVPSTLLRLDELLAAPIGIQHPAIATCLSSVAQTGGRIHLLGLLSDGGVHSHEGHLHQLLKICTEQTETEIFIHPILDGRDVPPSSAVGFLERLEDLLRSLGRGTIASVQGRFYAMDRDNNHERTALAMRMLRGQVPLLTSKWREVLARSYRHGVTDEFVVPAILQEAGAIRPGDGVIFFNTRPDRARQLAAALMAPENDGDKLAFFLSPIAFNGMVTAPNQHILFEQHQLNDTLLHVLAEHKKKVFVIAETEKYAHVTYFFQGLHEEALPFQERVLVPSIKTKKYVAVPEMSAHQITAALIKSLRSDPAFFYLVNFANPDMVGHSGDLAATIKACEIIDQQLALLYHEVVERLGGTLCITADHGNAEYVLDESGKPVTAHTINPVPIVFVSKKLKILHKWPGFSVENLPENSLAQVAPTLLTSMGLPVPSAMCGKLLI